MPSPRHDPSSPPPDRLSSAYLHSLTLTNPNLTLDATNKTLSVRPTPNQTPTVFVISGSALRFTPYIASFVGPGLLTACIGSKTPAASDPIEQVRIAIQERVLTSQRVLFIVPQSGDDEELVREAGLSAKSHAPAMQFERLTVPNTLHLSPGSTLSGRPGAGLPLLLKICSATAARGYSLQEVLRVGKLVAKNLLSLGSNLGPDLADRGPNYERFAEPSMPSRVRNMVSRMLDQKLRHADFVEVNSNEVVLLISGHSGLTMLEMGAVTSEVVEQLKHWHIRPVRIYTESVSALSVLGREGIRNRDFAITILNVCNTDIGGPSMIQLLDAPAEAAGWTAFVKGNSWEAKNTRIWERNAQWVKPSGLKCDPQAIWRAATSGSRGVVAFAKRNKLEGGYPYETWYGDLGIPPAENDHGRDIWTSAKGATVALAALPSLSDDIVILMNDMLYAIAPALDNPFGALCTIFLSALTQSFRAQSETADEVNIGVWIYALEKACLVLSEHARHRPIMFDTFDTVDRFLITLHSTGDVSKAAKAAEASEYMKSDLGAQLMCAFFAGLAGPVNGKAEQSSDVDEATETVEEQRKEEQPDKVGPDSAGEGLQAEVLDQNLQEERPTGPTSETKEPVQTSTEDKNAGASDAAVSTGLPESSTKESAGRGKLIASLGAALGLTSKEETSKEEVAQAAPTEEGRVSDASRDAIVDALQIKQSDFDAAMEGIRSRELIPLPTRQIEEMTLLDMVRKQIETLGVSSKDKSTTKDADEEEYELV